MNPLFGVKKFIFFSCRKDTASGLRLKYAYSIEQKDEFTPKNYQLQTKPAPTLISLKCVLAPQVFLELILVFYIIPNDI